MKTAILILGMHRSGTSALSGVLSHLNVEFGVNLMTAKEDNPKGFYENQRIYNLNQRILNSANAKWDSINVDLGSIDPSRKAELIQEAIQTIKEEFDFYDIFAIKDPRLCRLLPFWQEVLEEHLSIEIKVILPYRNPLEVAKSLARRNGMSYHKGLTLWIEHILDAEKTSRNHKRIFLGFDDLMKDKSKKVQELISFLNLNVEESIVKAATDFLEDDLKHINYQYNTYNNQIPDNINKLISLLPECEDQDSRDEFDSFHYEYTKYKSLFYHKELLDQLESIPELKKTISNLNSELKKLSNQLDTVEKDYKKTVETLKSENAAQLSHTLKEVETLKKENQLLKNRLLTQEQTTKASAKKQENLIKSLLSSLSNLQKKSQVINVGGRRQKFLKHVAKALGFDLVNFERQASLLTSVERISTPELLKFDSLQYERQYNDVKEAINAKIYHNALEHYVLAGHLEIHTGKRKDYRNSDKSKSKRNSNSIQNIKSDHKLNERYNFRIENVDGDKVRGWIFEKDNANSSSILLTLYIDGVKISSTSNDLLREDVNKKLAFRGNCGFEIKIPSQYHESEKHKAEVFIESDDSNQLLTEFEFIYEHPWSLESDHISNKPRILFCSHNLRSQGAQNSLFELAMGLKLKFGIDPVIYSPVDGPLRDKYEHNHIKVIVDNSFNLNVSNQEQWDSELGSFANKLLALNCDAMIVNTLPMFYMVYVAKFLNVRSLMIPRESETPKTYFNYLNSFLRKIALDSLQHASQVIFVAESTRAPWDDIHPDNNYKVIHNSLNTALISASMPSDRIEVRHTFNIQEDDIVLLSLGTVSERKGQIDFVKALPAVMDKNPNVKAFIVGCVESLEGDIGKYNKKIRDLIFSYSQNIQNRIVLIPETDKLEHTKPSEFYAMADIFVFTSRIESFPRVMLEAMYFGLPIVTTPCFGVVEQCIENENALYYKANDIKKLANNINSLIVSPEKRKQFGKQSLHLFNTMPSYHTMLARYHDSIATISEQ